MEESCRQTNSQSGPGGSGDRGGPDGPGGSGRPDVGERMVRDLLERARCSAAELLADAVVHAAAPLGVRQAVIYMADLGQESLVPLHGDQAWTPGSVPLSIDGTPAGRVYRTLTPYQSDREGGRTLWLPLVDGADRLGVLELSLPEIVPDRARLMLLASLVGLLLATKRAYSDTVPRTRRTQLMTLSAEMEWVFMPPLTFSTEDVQVGALLEPAYELGGDAFDYSLSGDHLHVSIYDAMGHDLDAGLLAAVALASCRNARRNGGDLPDLAELAEEAVAEHFGGERFITAVLADIDIRTGVMRWINCGHPPPLLVRQGKVVKRLDQPPRLPLGLGDTQPAAVYEERLQRGDQVLLFTDGVSEARSPEGELLGIDRVCDLVVRTRTPGLPVAEGLRRFVRALAEHQHGRLRDDTTVVLVEWGPSPAPSADGTEPGAASEGGGT
ncbi:serine/threonine-protein phosphatase [Microbispora sp. RL4-1S]|uniref:Serine/threonine-protein phosphatase n=1 Tax=Microbispora oryzae TaxID=2806554 RepID=A0A940WE13_9ACTN|nr:PP2C family protein-serine/threonine phosphatase [Microbispora oryzae]MBP2703805.1 serine/threonine-protein phosphatase [Microbispora oryzae]